MFDQTAADRSETAPPGRLGHSAKSATPPTPQTEVESHLRRDERVEDRFELLRAAAFLLRAEHTHALVGEGVGGGDGAVFAREGKDGRKRPVRMAYCRWNVGGQGAPTARYASEYGRAFWSGLQTCGSASCPVCGPKIGERRKGEVLKFVEWAEGAGARLLFLTLTAPHRPYDHGGDLASFTASLAAAYKHARSGSKATRFRKRVGEVGWVRSFDYTHGRNGHHGHYHILAAVCSDVSNADFLDGVRSLWRLGCVKAGLLDPNDAKQMAAFEKIGVDVRSCDGGADGAARYLVKDEVAAEVARPDAKRKGLGAEGLLRIAAGLDVGPLSKDGRPLYSPARAGRLWLEFVAATFGQSRVQFQPGLKKRIGLDEKTDEEVADEEREASDLGVEFSVEGWRSLRGIDRSRARGGVLNVLAAARRGGGADEEVVAAVRAWLFALGWTGTARLAANRGWGS